MFLPVCKSVERKQISIGTGIFNLPAASFQ
jgi:hypothetical protein